MPATLSTQFRDTDGKYHAWYSDLNLGTYATGGVSVTPNQLGLRTIVNVLSDHANGYALVYDRTAQKFKAFNGTTEVANSTDLSGTTFRVKAVGHE